ncbi:MAG: chorismate mutase [Chlamydiia bacterium]|nr:chorismate mutase [Chlamydiia bacterium]
MELEDLRKEIDRLNQEIIFLLSKRKEVTLKIAQVKKEQDLPILDEEREKKQRLRIETLARKQGLNPQVIATLFEDFITYCREEMESSWESSP